MPKILFICRENSCRSQMAEAFANHLRLPEISAFSAGSSPSGQVSPLAVSVMKEIGIDISGAESKGIASFEAENFDCVVSMGCGDKCPLVDALRQEEWQISDPRGGDLVFFREVRDQIEHNVRNLVARLLSEERDS